MEQQPVVSTETEETTSPVEKKEMPKKNAGNAIAAGIIVAVLIMLSLGYVLVQRQVMAMSEQPVVVALSRLYQIPAATVNGQKILYADYMFDKQVLTTYSQSEEAQQAPVPPTEDSIRELSLYQLILGEVVGQVGEEYGVEITNEDIEIKRQELLSQFPDEAVAASTISDLYGLDLDQYIAHFAPRISEEQKVRAAYMAEFQTNDPAKGDAQDLIDRINVGEDFAALAGEYGTDATRETGGDLGWFARGAMVAPFEEAAFSLEVGELVAEPVETMFGYHVLQVTDKRTSTDESGEEFEEVQARHILVPSNAEQAFSEYMNTKLEEAEIVYALPLRNPFDVQMNEQALEGAIQDMEAALEEQESEE